MVSVTKQAVLEALFFVKACVKFICLNLGNLVVCSLFMFKILIFKRFSAQGSYLGESISLEIMLISKKKIAKCNSSATVQTMPLLFPIAL